MLSCKTAIWCRKRWWKGVSLDYTEVATDAEEYKAVEEYLKDTNSTFEMYDISLLDKDEKKVQPDGMVEVTVKLSDAMKNAAGDALHTFCIHHFITSTYSMKFSAKKRLFPASQKISYLLYMFESF